MAESHADAPPAADASTSGRVSQRDLPLKPGYYNKRDDTVPCGALNVKVSGSVPRPHRRRRRIAHPVTRGDQMAIWQSDPKCPNAGVSIVTSPPLSRAPLVNLCSC
jgi:hypothetical protein